MKNQNKKNNYGFTLIELLVTISIFGILSFYAVPFFGQIIHQKDLETAKNKIVHSLQKAKKIANAENTFVDVKISDNLIILSPKNKNDSITIKIPSRITTESTIYFTFSATGNITKPSGEVIDSITNIRISETNNPSVFETITVSNMGLIAAL